MLKTNGPTTEPRKRVFDSWTFCPALKRQRILRNNLKTDKRHQTTVGLFRGPHPSDRFKILALLCGDTVHDCCRQFQVVCRDKRSEAWQYSSKLSRPAWRSGQWGPLHKHCRLKRLIWFGAGQRGLCSLKRLIWLDAGQMGHLSRIELFAHCFQCQAGLPFVGYMEIGLELAFLIYFLSSHLEWTRQCRLPWHLSAKCITGSTKAHFT